MKLLFAIPHFFDPHGGGAHQSLNVDSQPRIEALRSCLLALHHLFGRGQKMLDISRRAAVPANAKASHEVDVVICTIGKLHLLDQLPFGGNAYRRHDCRCEPKLLGFECHQVLRERLGEYDYYCYLEDDLVLHDPWFISKLAWFNEQAGDECLLQPNRYEVPQHVVGRKVYVDGDVRPQVTDRFRDQRSLPEIHREIFGVGVVFRGALNPHAGCFFLNAAQMRRWSAQPWFGDRDTSFISPLESAATLGILRTFNIYKSAASQASFLEVQHYGEGYLRYVGAGFPLDE